jgi:hypothetical protein
MKANWQEVPNGDMSPQTSGIYVTMNPKGQIAMSRGTYQMLDEPPAFLVLYDKANNRVGLQPAALSTKNAYRACKHNSCGGRAVHCYRLTRIHRIDLPQTVRFFDADIDEDGILRLDLRTARVPNRVLNHAANRKKKVGGDPT